MHIILAIQTSSLPTLSTMLTIPTTMALYTTAIASMFDILMYFYIKFQNFIS